MSGLASCVQPQNYSSPDNATAAPGAAATRPGTSATRPSAQVRRHGAADNRFPGASCRRERLVQPRARSPRGHRRDLRHRFVRGQDLLDARHSDRLARRHPPRPGREPEPGSDLWVQVRRDEPVGDGGAVPPAKRQRLVPGAAHRRLQRGDATSGVSSCEPRRATAAGRRRRLVGGTCRDQAGNTGTASFVEVRRRPRRRRAPQPRAHRTRTAGSTLHSASASPGRIPRRGSTPVQPLRTTAGRTVGTASISGTCLDKAGNAVTASLALVRRDSAADQRVPPTERGRLVHRAAHGRLLGDRRDLDGRLM